MKVLDLDLPLKHVILISLSHLCRCIPYRYKNGNHDIYDDDYELEVLVVSSQKGQRMMFPKVRNYKPPNYCQVTGPS